MSDHSTSTNNASTTTAIAPVPFLDIKRENSSLQRQFASAFAEISQSGRFIMGPECQTLERKVAEICGADHGIGCASGSDALLLSLMARGIGRGDEVIVPSFTFFATASAVWRLGARPVFVDILPDTYMLDPEKVQAAVTDRTKAIIPVHLFGRSADMPSLMRIAKSHELFVVEDAAQAIGAAYEDRPAGGWGDVGCISFYPTKNLGGFGDGGMLVTSDDELAEQLRLLRTHGMKPRYYHEIVGINSRLDAIQAAVLNVKLPHLAEWTERRQAHARRYDSLFRRLGLDRWVAMPQTSSSEVHVFNQYTIRVSDGRRDQLREHLTNCGIGTEIYYPIPLHRQSCFASLGYPEGSLPETEKAAKQVLSLPIFPHLTSQEQDRVVRSICKFFQPTMPLPPLVQPNHEASSQELV